LKDLQFLKQQFQLALPNISNFIVVGNNDSYTGDYEAENKSVFLKQSAVLWVDLIKQSENKKAFLNDYPSMGYYAVDLDDRYRLIVLNTVLFSVSVTNPKADLLALAQLDWLHQQLSTARQDHKMVLMAYHIPQGLNLVSTFRNYLNGLQDFWRATYINIFNNDIKEFAGLIKGMMAAHVHREELAILGINHQSLVKTTITPSISPIFGNNPTFKVFLLDEASGELSDTTYSYRWNKELTAQAWQTRQLL
jgi:sphingomyelin phosphodiesterase acid-like 3